MTDNKDDRQPAPPASQSELLPAILAVALAVAAQLALNDGLTLLAVAGYVAATWLFVSTVRGIFDAGPAVSPDAEEGVGEASVGAETAESAPVQPVAGANRPAGRLGFLRHNWRLVTLAEIFTGDIPPARLGDLQPAALPAADQPALDDAVATVALDEEEGGAPAPVAGEAQLQSWTAADSPASSPKAVKVTPQGDVLVLDAGLEQVQRFDQRGKLLATYSLAGLASLEILDLAISPDGQTLYVVEAASKRLQVITLTGDESAGEEE